MISKIIQPEEAAQTFVEWAENPAQFMKILVQF